MTGRTTAGRVVCRLTVGGLAILYAFALAFLAVGTFGLFGNPPDALSGIYVILLGLPWNLLLDGLPEAWAPWAASLAPLVNIALVASLCRLARRRHNSAI
ncbi:hypothetical protein AB7M35_003783 [Amorphus suaedae]